MSQLYFLWDYDLNENQVRDILVSGTTSEKQWLVARILTHARYEDIWKYLTISDILKIFPQLKIRPSVKQMWQHTFRVWGYHV